MPPRAAIARLPVAFARLMRLVLPLGALVLLSTIFLFSRSIDPDLAVQQADLDIAELTREPRIGTARIAGVTSEDTALTIDAVSIRASSDLQAREPLRLVLDQPHGTLAFTSGRDARFRAETGRLDQEMNQLVMRGDVRLETSDGYDARMQELTTALDRTDVQGHGGVSGTGPPGDISAETVTLTPAPGDASGYLLAFRGNVRLLYQPEQE